MSLNSVARKLSNHVFVTIMDIHMYHYIRHLQTKDKSTNEEMERWISECYKKEVDSYVTKIRNFIKCIIII